MAEKLILLIEDDYLDVENVRRELAKLQLAHTLKVVHNGQEGIDYLTNVKNQVPDVILLDINMPRMNGFEFLRIIKNYHNFKNIKVYGISTSSEEYDKIVLKSLGVDGYIVKPLRLSGDKLSDSNKQLVKDLKN
jgi:CheY-like chemotaxis protein